MRIKWGVVIGIVLVVLGWGWPVKVIEAGVGSGRCDCGEICSFTNDPTETCVCAPCSGYEGGPSLDCSNDGPTNRCGGEESMGDTCPAGYTYTCDVNRPVCDPARKSTCGYTGSWCDVVWSSTPGVRRTVDCPPCYWIPDDYDIPQWTCLNPPTYFYECYCQLVCSPTTPGQIDV